MGATLFHQPSDIRITCAAEVSPWLAQEVADLAYKLLESGSTYVSIKGTLTQAAHLCTHLRTAYKVLYFLEEFTASHPDGLYQKLFAMNWQHILPNNGYVCVESFTQNDFIRDTRFTNLKAKDAIVDKIKHATGKRPDSGPDHSHSVIYLHWVEKKVKVYLDASGESLTRQGYRTMPHKAPLQESLAAAIIHACGWDKNSTFINPMCGSGTLAIQAALMACKIYPGNIRKNYGFMHVMGYQLVDKASIWPADSTVGDLPFKIIATDHDVKAIQAAKTNAAQAGVAHLINFEVCDFTKTHIPAEKGVLIINPEYGERLGEVGELVKIYSSIGDFFKQKCVGYNGFIFTGNRELAGKIGLKPFRKTVFYNGRIECRLLAYEMYAGKKENR